MKIINNDKSILEKALIFAGEKHKGQKRKGTNLPYFTHIASVVEILLANGASFSVCAAGALHDTLEDTNTTIDEIVKNFGVEIAVMVDTVTERKTLEYMDRKHMQSLRIGASTKEVKMIKCADCLANLRDTLKDHKQPNFWKRFNATKEKIAEHYLETLNAVSELEGTAMYEEFKSIYYQIFSDLSSQTTTKSEQEEALDFLKTKLAKELYLDPDFDKFSKNDQAIYEFLHKKKENESPIKRLSEKTEQPPLVSSKQPIKFCTDCAHMGRITTPDPDDWFNDDDQAYVCNKNGKVLSQMNRPYEKQVAPKDCPLER